MNNSISEYLLNKDEWDFLGEEGGSDGKEF